MKRSEALQPLSRDHHQALFIAQRLRRVDEAAKEEAREAFLEFWREHGRRHFRVEEEVLLPAYARFGDPEHPDVVRVLTDHVLIRRLAADVERGEATLDLLHEIGSRLDGHVRHEERVLFPLIESALPDEALADLVGAVAHAEAFDRSPSAGFG